MSNYIMVDSHGYIRTVDTEDEGREVVVRERDLADELAEDLACTVMPLALMKRGRR